MAAPWEQDAIVSGNPWERDAPVGEPAAAPKKQVGAGSAFGRGLMKSYADTGNLLTMALGGAGVIGDKLISQFTDQPFTGLQEAAFSRLVDPTRQAQEYWKVNPQTEQYESGWSEASGVAGTLTGILNQAVAQPGAMAGQVVPLFMKPAMQRVPGVVQRVAPLVAEGAIKAQLPFAQPGAVTRTQELLDAGVDMPTAAGAGATNLIGNTLMGALPVSVAGGKFTRAASGVGLGVPTGVAMRGAEGMVLGDENADLAQPAFGAKEVGTDAGISALMALLFGPRASAAQLNARADAQAQLDAQAQADLVQQSIVPDSGISIADLIQSQLLNEAPPMQDVKARRKDAGVAFGNNPEDPLIYRRDSMDPATGEMLPATEAGSGTLATNTDRIAGQRQAMNAEQMGGRPVDPDTAAAYGEAGIDPNSVASAFERARLFGADEQQAPEVVAPIDNGGGNVGSRSAGDNGVPGRSGMEGNNLVPRSAADSGVVQPGRRDADTGGNRGGAVETGTVADAGVKNRAVDDAAVRDEVRIMADNTGLVEKGGYVLRTFDETTGRGEVTGRTKAVPKEDWWLQRPSVDTVGKRGKEGRRFKHSEAETKQAVADWLAGKPLKRKQQEIVDFMRDVAEQRLREQAEYRAMVEEDAAIARAEREAIQAADEFDAPPMTDAEIEAMFRGIDDEAQADFGQYSAREAAEGNRGSEGNAEGQARDSAEAQPPILERPTADDIRARDDAARAADEQRRAAERKAEVDAEPFVMTGSNRAVDQAEARGQRSLLDEPARPQSQQNVDNQPAAPKIEDVPLPFMERLEVDAHVYDAETGKWKKEQVPAREALDAVGEDVALYRRLLDCLRR